MPLESNYSFGGLATKWKTSLLIKYAFGRVFSKIRAFYLFSMSISEY